MAVNILVSSIVVIMCVFLNKVANKIGVPMLLVFILLGMFFGTDGLFKINFDNFALAEFVCSIALIFIMFYGGFGTNWNQGRPAAVRATLLSTLGVLITAGLTGLFCWLVLRLDVMESFLIGAVISSTDAASVFAILRYNKLGLKDNVDSLLEIESGSNDPSSYMLTIIVLSFMHGNREQNIFLMVFLQFAVGIGVGIAIAHTARYILRNFKFEAEGFDMAFITGTALFAYSLSAALGGNGFLSTYIAGVMVGNCKIPNKKAIFNFFDGITGLMQMFIFFLLGLLATPSRIWGIALPALLIMIFLTFIARPIAVFGLLHWFKMQINQLLLISFAGLRGAASIVFAIMAIASNASVQTDIFHIVFCIVLLSITFQGSLLATLARKLDVADSSKDISKTFSDYTADTDMSFISIRLENGHPWIGQPIRSISIPPDTLIVLAIRNGKKIIPSGSTVLKEGDTAIISAYKYHDEGMIHLTEHYVEKGDELVNTRIQDSYPNPNELVIMIIRDEKAIVPNGGTVILEGDTLVINS